jgi:cysteine desulfurase
MDIKEKIYFDNAASTPMLEEVMYEMIPYMRIAYGNPSSTHSFGRETKSAIELCRKKIAGMLNCKGSEITFTSGGTEANNLAFYIAVNSLDVKAIITAKTEHKAVLNTARSYQEQIPVFYVDIDKEGTVDLDHLERLLAENPNSLLSLMHANNEIGTLHPIQKINELVSKYNGYFHTDAVQSFAHYPIDLNQLSNVHFLSASAHKFHGPKGIGFLYIKKGTKSLSQLKGGPQERELRAGTENVSAIVGMTLAAELAYKDLDDRKATVLALREELKIKLLEHFPLIKFNGIQGENSLYTILNVSFPPSKSREMLPFALDLKGIAVSAGSACSSGSTAFSHVLRAIGSRDDWPAIRFSFSHLNTSKEIDRLITALKEILLK